MLFALIFSTQLHAAPLGACGCVWDNSTKEYPDGGTTKGVFRTTVRYQCGYICEDSAGKLHRVLGDHQVSFVTEAGNEVVCDGLAYRAQPAPPGMGRAIIYAWDGITSVFFAKQSKSPTVRTWSEAHCAAATPAPTQIRFAAAGLDQVRAQAGMPLLNPPKPPAKAKPAALSKELEILCSPSPRQQEFIAGKETCAPDQEESLRKDFDQIVADSYRLTSAEAPAKIEKTERLLLCPYLDPAPNFAMMKILQDKLVKLTHEEASLIPATKHLFCTMAHRGLRWNYMSSLTQTWMRAL